MSIIITFFACLFYHVINIIKESCNENSKNPQINKGPIQNYSICFNNNVDHNNKYFDNNYSSYHVDPSTKYNNSASIDINNYIKPSTQKNVNKLISINTQKNNKNIIKNTMKNIAFEKFNSSFSNNGNNN